MHVPALRDQALLPLSLPQYVGIKALVVSTIVALVLDLANASSGRGARIALLTFTLIATTALDVAQAWAHELKHELAREAAQSAQALDACELVSQSRRLEALQTQVQAEAERRRTATREIEALGMPTMMALLPWERSPSPSSAASSTAPSPCGLRRAENPTRVEMTPSSASSRFSSRSPSFKGSTTQPLVNLSMYHDAASARGIIAPFYLPSANAPRGHAMRLIDNLANSYRRIIETGGNEPTSSEASASLAWPARRLADAAATAGAARLSARSKEFAAEPAGEQGLSELTQLFEATRAQLMHDGVLDGALLASPPAPAVWAANERMRGTADVSLSHSV